MSAPDGQHSGGAIRRLRRADRESWEPLWHGYLRFYRAEPNPGWSDKTFAALTGDDPRLLGLLAVDPDGRAVGLAHLVLHPSTWSARESCYLNDLFVSAEARGGGHARRLIGAVYAEARARGCATVYWHTQEFNQAARSLYDTVAQLTSFRVYEHDL